MSQKDCSEEEQEPNPQDDDGIWYGWTEEEHNQAFGITDEEENESEETEK